MQSYSARKWPDVTLVGRMQRSDAWPILCFLDASCTYVAAVLLQSTSFGFDV